MSSPEYLYLYLTNTICICICVCICVLYKCYGEAIKLYPAPIIPCAPDTGKQSTNAGILQQSSSTSFSTSSASSTSTTLSPSLSSVECFGALHFHFTFYKGHSELWSNIFILQNHNVKMFFFFLMKMIVE